MFVFIVLIPSAQYWSLSGRINILEADSSTVPYGGSPCEVIASCEGRHHCSLSEHSILLLLYIVLTIYRAGIYCRSIIYTSYRLYYIVFQTSLTRHENVIANQVPRQRKFNDVYFSLRKSSIMTFPRYNRPSLLSLLQIEVSTLPIISIVIVALFSTSVSLTRQPWLNHKREKRWTS